MPLPTFVIPGVQKAATTTLHDLLGQHPRIWVSRPKELHFFDRRRDRGLEWYSAQFTPGPEHLAWGESTPRYLYQDVAREEMARSLPDARYVVMLREPVSRAYSQYWFARSRGVESLPTFAEALAAEPARIAQRRDRQPAKFSYLDRGHYLRQLQSLEDVVGRERILVHLLEDLIADSLAVLRDTCAFLGVEAPSPEVVVPMARNTFAAPTLNRRPEAAAAPADDRAPGVPRVAYPPIDPDLDRTLRDRFCEENMALADWLGRDLSHWL